MSATAPMTSRIEITSDALIQMGASTHHHDQSILPSSLSTTNTIVSSPTKPMPPDDEDEFEFAMLMSNHGAAANCRPADLLIVDGCSESFVAGDHRLRAAVAELGRYCSPSMTKIQLCFSVKKC